MFIDQNKFDFDLIPQEMKRLNTWMIADQNKKKAPEDTSGNIRGYNTYYQTDFQTAKETAIKKNKLLSFSINEGDNIMCIDLDNCFDNNFLLKTWAKKLIKHVTGKAYIEYSYSQKGLHIFLIDGKNFSNTAIKMKDIIKKESDKSGIEIYVSNKNIAITGWIYNNSSEIKISSEELKFFQDDILIYKQILKDKKDKKKKINSNVFELIINSIDLNTIISSYGIKIKDKGLICPFHNEKTPSFHINKDNKTAKCYGAGCDWYGDAIQFVADMEHVSNLDAAKLINDNFSLGIDFFQPVDNNVETVEKNLNPIYQYNKYKGLKSYDKDIVIKNNYYGLEEWGNGYYVTDKGFVKRFNDERQYIDVLITPIQIIPDKLLYYNNKEELLLSIRSGNNIETEVLKSEKAFSSTTNFRIFLSSIFPSSSWFCGKLQDVIEYEKYICALAKSMKIKRQNAYDKIGWNNDEFLPYSQKYMLYQTGDTESLIIDRLKNKGNFDLWTETIKKNLNNDIFRMYINMSLASPILSILKLNGFGFYNYAPPSRGKTISSYAAWSIWGKPDSISVPSFNVTRAGIESRLNTLNNLPAVFDDSQQLNGYSKNQIDKIIYDMSNGSGKTRMTKEAKSGSINSWNLTFILTGERELLNNKIDGGAFKRLLEINGEPFTDKKLARESKIIFAENYGFLGPLFIDYIKKNKTKLLVYLNKIEDKLFNDNNIPDHILNMAILALCDGILNTIIKHSEDQLDWANRILKYLPKVREIDKVEIGLEIIKELTNSNPTRFDQTSLIEKWGFIKNEQYCFFPYQLKKILADNDIPEKHFLDSIKKMQIVELDKNNNFKIERHGNQVLRPVQFKASMFELDKDEIEDHEDAKIIDMFNN